MALFNKAPVVSDQRLGNSSRYADANRYVA